MDALIQPIREFLKTETPTAWLQIADQHLDELLIDHANCELKAAQAAVRVLRQCGSMALASQCQPWLKAYERVAYGHIEISQFLAALPQRPMLSASNELEQKLLMLIREELHHFQQVLEIMHRRCIRYPFLQACRYAQRLQQACRSHQPAKQIDMLIVGAIIEARSCERFAALLPYLDEELVQFYRSLLHSEARHFQDYLGLAQQLANEDIAARVAQLTEFEASLIQQPEACFRFHSGVPVRHSVAVGC